jgi:small subunit ribosomal protein S17
MAENQENIPAETQNAAPAAATSRAHRSQKVGTVASDKMQKTVSKFMAHDELGATVGDRVRIVETRPLSARKRWRVVEIVQKAAK